jgi:hypothetical protein
LAARTPNPGGGPWTPQIAYSTNVHPGEDLAAVERSLREFTVPIRERVFGSAPCGLELRIGIGGARDLAARGARERFSGFLEDSRLVLFSVNAYPLTDFHARRVKETVYTPSWAEPARARWTSAIAQLADDLAPRGLELSISTLGGCFRGHGHGPRVFRKLAANYLAACASFLAIRERTGRELTLGVEPEPETTFETAADVVEFFERYLLPLALASWKRRGKRGRIETDLRRVFGVNLDTCHLSVLFEDPVESLHTLGRAGIRLAKMHVTNAVALRQPFRSPRAYQDLRAMDEPRYFHQFCGRDDGGRLVWRGLDLDRLPRRLERGRHPPVAEIRSHFHVPLYLARYRRLHTTRDETETAVREVAARRLTSHLVFETYTWPILTGRERRRERLIAGICREYRWLLGLLARLGVGRADRADR